MIRSSIDVSFAEETIVVEAHVERKIQYIHFCYSGATFHTITYNKWLNLVNSSVLWKETELLNNMPTFVRVFYTAFPMMFSNLKEYYQPAKNLMNEIKDNIHSCKLSWAEAKVERPEPEETDQLQTITGELPLNNEMRIAKIDTGMCGNKFYEIELRSNQWHVKNLGTKHDYFAVTDERYENRAPTKSDSDSYFSAKLVKMLEDKTFSSDSYFALSDCNPVREKIRTMPKNPKAVQKQFELMIKSPHKVKLDEAIKVIWKELYAITHYYVTLEHKKDYDIVIAFNILTYFSQLVTSYVYLLFRGAHGTGKSSTTKLIDIFGYRSIFGSMSDSSSIRAMHSLRGVHCLDDLDNIFDNPREHANTLRILKSGSSKGSKQHLTGEGQKTPSGKIIRPIEGYETSGFRAMNTTMLPDDPPMMSRCVVLLLEENPNHKGQEIYDDWNKNNWIRDYLTLFRLIAADYFSKKYDPAAYSDKMNKQLSTHETKVSVRDGKLYTPLLILADLAEKDSPNMWRHLMLLARARQDGMIEPIAELAEAFMYVLDELNRGMQLGKKKKFILPLEEPIKIRRSLILAKYFNLSEEEVKQRHRRSREARRVNDLAGNEGITSVQYKGVQHYLLTPRNLYRLLSKSKQKVTKYVDPKWGLEVIKENLQRADPSTPTPERKVRIEYEVTAQDIVKGYGDDLAKVYDGCVDEGIDPRDVLAPDEIMKVQLERNDPQTCKERMRELRDNGYDISLYMEPEQIKAANEKSDENVAMDITEEEF